MYQWWLYAHLLSVAGFLLAHGTSAAMGLRLRQEKSPEAIRSVTGLSKQTNNATYGFLLLIIITGVSMGFQDNWWRFAWIWVALGVLILTIGAMNGLSRPYHDVRVGVGLPGRGPQRGPVPAPASSEQLEQLVARANPVPISAIGVAALLILLWLMILKPF